MEQRAYRRIEINIDGVFFVEQPNGERLEFPGIIKDISEGGIGIVINEVLDPAIVDAIDIGTQIHFQAFDSYDFFGDEHSVIVGSVSKAVRKVVNADSIIIGCKISILGKELEQYIKEKHVIQYMELKFMPE